MQKLDHADIWSKLKVANSHSKSKSKTDTTDVLSGPFSNAPPMDDSMSQALAALNKIAPPQCEFCFIKQYNTIRYCNICTCICSANIKLLTFRIKEAVCTSIIDTHRSEHL